MELLFAQTKLGFYFNVLKFLRSAWNSITENALAILQFSNNILEWSGCAVLAYLLIQTINKTSVIVTIEWCKGRFWHSRWSLMQVMFIERQNRISLTENVGNAKSLTIHTSKTNRFVA
ncbi:MAG: hypothetical protein N2035_05760 [Chthoniobacterales bacterium]|nr:hypothetical protein [Chthoniobacterales bacterium]